MEANAHIIGAEEGQPTKNFMEDKKVHTLTTS